ncbi:MAG: dehydrogenase, partial [Verrucomicrobiales bacterium]|nr:dehydrogenase [Verrucomicrobiales bacterium]
VGPIEKYSSLKTFATSEEMIRSGEVDAVLIATPHFSHTTIGIDALQNGVHILVEKPISVHKADCERVIAEHKKTKLVFGAMFQARTENRFKRMKRMIENGELGKLTRMSWIVTDWYRTEIYYSSGGWRATWKGEGGGALLNQCPHNLDMLQWLCGRPSKVRGFAQLGRFHNIEVEDNVTAYLEFPNGATGVFITSTGEAPGTNRLEIVGEKGKLVLEQGKLSFTRNEVSMLEFSQTAQGGFSKPEVWNADIPIDNAPGRHEEIVQNFVDSILDGKPLIAPGEEGIWSVELANSILYSSLENRELDLPLDAQAYEKKLNELIANSKTEKKVVKPTVDDFAKSFAR